MYWIKRLDASERISLGDSPITIGRTTNVTIRLTDPTVSRVHCIVYTRAGRVFVADPGSKNGTFIDGEPVASQTEWQPGGRLTLGSTAAAFNLVAEPADSPSSAGGESTPSPTGGEPGAADSEDSARFVAARVLLPLVLVWLLLSQAVFFDGLFRGLLPSGTDAGPADRRADLSEVERLRARFGADDVPESPEFETVLLEYVAQYAESPDFALALERRSDYLQSITTIFRESSIPPAYSAIPIVESFYRPRAWNRRTDARGLWQFRPRTAREYGLVITSNRDDRLDPIASTRAAAEYLADLLAVFGADSLSLVAAAYNAGDARVRYALRQIEDPTSERTVWHLSRRKLLPVETRQYVLKLLASLILIDRYGAEDDTRLR